MNDNQKKSVKGYVPSFLLKDRHLLFNGTKLTKYASIACKELFINENLIT